MISRKIRTVSLSNARKKDNYDNYEESVNQKHENYFQAYCQTSANSVTAFKHKSHEKEKVKKRIHDSFEKKLEAWK